MSADELGILLTEEQQRVALPSREVLIRWLRAGRREFLILNAVHLVEALPFPTGVLLVQQLVADYGQHRRLVPTAFVESGSPDKVPVMHEERLSLDEIDAAMNQLRQLREEVTEDYARRKVVRA